MADRLRDATLHSAVTVSTSRPDTPPARALAPVGSLGDRIANIGVTVVPLLLLGFAIYIAWGGTLHWQDLVVLAIVYVPVGFGVTVGFHRLFTHRSFQTYPALRALWAILGSAAVEGPVIEWVAYHRKHHAFSDEVGDPHNLAIRLRLNGETMQDSSTRQMIFPAPEVVAYLSQVFTLEPGDLIFTGTPPGVGIARKPPVFLKAGDVVEVEIEKLGILRNPVVQG